MRDYMLLARPAGDMAPFIRESFGTVVDGLKRAVTRACPQVTWQADFNLGGGQFVEIFSAPDQPSATRVSQIVHEIEGVRAEVRPLRESWEKLPVD